MRGFDKRRAGWCKARIKNAEPTLEHAARSRTGMPVTAANECGILPNSGGNTDFSSRGLF